MFGIGTQELIILLIILLVIIVPIWVSIRLRKKVPNKQWLAITLSIIFCPWGHLYLEGAAGYIIALFLLAGISKALTGAFLLPFVASPLMMWYRFNKLSKARTLDVS
jgi:hypothetical protein